MTVQAVLDELLIETGASRITLRQDVPGETFPVTHEALSTGVPSIRGLETPNMAGQPVVLAVTQGRQVVQDDCARLFPGDAAFHAMLELYGGMRAQVVTPVSIGGHVAAIVSVHQLGDSRSWSPSDVACCSDAAERVRTLLEESG